MKNINSLRKRYPRFLYKGYSFAYQDGELKISFDFSVPVLSRVEGPPDIQFYPTVIIKNVSKKDLEKVDERVLNNLIFHLGLMEIPSYWKATCSPKIVVEAGHLNKQQIQWWTNIIFNGMGEYFYKNKIDFTKPNFLKISSWHSLPKRDLGMPKSRLGNKTLVPVGGGKDAVVTLELLKKALRLRSGQAQEAIIPFVLNPKKEQIEIIRLAKVGKPVVVQRTIDPKLLELNRKGYLNGHTPFSAYLAFLSVFAAVLFGYRYIALSNERSSNEGNIKYLGQMINHQYSKSFDFEKKIREYAKRYLAKNIEYFSFLRPLYELQIARIFARYPKYFPVFLSCNEARKTSSGTKKATGTWCGKCAKCLFVFAALYPFVTTSQLVKIFRKNLFQDKSLIPLMKELTGQRRFKPFECVGTKEESVAAFSLSFVKEKNPSPLEIYFAKYILPKHPGMRNTTKNILKAWNQKHFVPEKLAKVLRKTLQEF